MKMIFIDLKRDQYAKRMKIHTSCFDYMIENHKFIMTVLKAYFLLCYS